MRSIQEAGHLPYDFVGAKHLDSWSKYTAAYGPIHQQGYSMDYAHVTHGESPKPLASKACHSSWSNADTAATPGGSSVHQEPDEAPNVTWCAPLSLLQHTIPIG